MPPFSIPALSFVVCVPRIAGERRRLCTALGCVFSVSKHWIIIGGMQLMYSEVSERNLGLLAAVRASFAFHLQDFHSINEECVLLSPK